jgi:hypothetical protein
VCACRFWGVDGVTICKWREGGVVGWYTCPLIAALHPGCKSVIGEFNFRASQATVVISHGNGGPGSGSGTSFESLEMTQNHV